MSLAVHFLPDLVPAQQLAGRTSVVIDVLRATTTITHALAAGARGVIPCVEVDAARRIATEMARGQYLPREYLLGGERGGVLIPGFDLSNSPAEYTPDVVRGKTIIFTTTNGTRALAHARLAREILLGSFVNLSALCARLKTADGVDVICAGTRAKISLDDVLVAGAIVDRLGFESSLPSSSQAARQRKTGQAPPGTSNIGSPADDQTTLALRYWQAATRGGRYTSRLADWLAESWGGRHLIELGFAADLTIAADVDRLGVVPIYDPDANRIALC
jgi:2-phosphosulfolactate phosphatase